MSREILDEERKYVAMLYGRFDELRAQAAARLSEALLPTGGSPQAHLHRDATVAHHGARLVQLDAVEEGLCFGRLQLRDGDDLHIGRIGMLMGPGAGAPEEGLDAVDASGPRAGAREEGLDAVDASGPEREPVLVDWRAPAARPFYTATGASPEGVARRRHIRTRRRQVLAVEEDVLDLADGGQLSGEAALLAALDAQRTGRMDAIVATIQTEQDRIIRSPHEGVLVVEGGPGTGKTAVALHRAAYLLYTHRQRLESEAVLVVGPTTTFLRYVGQVLPSLGERSVVLATVGELYPGITADAAEPPAVAEIKGRALMADVVAAALRDRERPPAHPLEIRLDREILTLQPATVADAVARARATGRTHNRARTAFRRPLIAALAEQLAEQIGRDPLTGRRLVETEQIASLRRDLAGDPAVQSVLDRLWPHLTPQELVRDLLASPERLAAAAPELTERERALLHRPPTHGWTPADIPLLDEAAELLGVDDAVERARDRRDRLRRETYAQGVIDFTSSNTSRSVEEAVLVRHVLDAKTLAERHEAPDLRTAAERAAADRAWPYGHVVVDEAQELSPMVWRVLARRCPRRSMTIVGDVAQTGTPGGTSSWEQVLGPVAGRRWRLAELTVNYRTPAEIAAVAADVLAAIDPALRAPRAVRATGVRPWRRQVKDAALAKEAAAAAADELAVLGEGRMAVVAPASRLAELAAALPGAGAGADPDLERPLVLLSVEQAKGLEFDTVLVADPDGIVAASPHGLNDLYVAVTRPTQRLGVLHTGRVPAVLRRLEALPDARPARLATGSSSSTPGCSA